MDRPARPASLDRRACLSLAAGLLAAFGLPSALAQPADPARRQADLMQSATVGVEVRAIEGSASATSLGPLREGSGVLVAPHNLVLTIGYLVLEAENVQLVTREGKRVPAQVAAYDPVTGLGLLRPLFPLPGVEAARLGTASTLARNAPLLFVTGSQPRQAGVVRLIDARPFTAPWEYHLDTALYTAPVLLGQSGAGLFNAQGELVGIGHLAMRDVTPDDAPVAIPGNLFVPVDVLQPVVAELLRTGRHPQAGRPWMGVNAAVLQGQVRITRVNPGSPAEEAGLKVGHQVATVDGQLVDSVEAFYKQVWAHRGPQRAISLGVREGDQVRTLEVPVQERGATLARPRGI